MVCRHCGHRVRKDRFCEYCGKPLGVTLERRGKIAEDRTEDPNQTTDWLDEETGQADGLGTESQAAADWDIDDWDTSDWDTGEAFALSDLHFEYGGVPDREKTKGTLTKKKIGQPEKRKPAEKRMQTERRRGQELSRIRRRQSGRPDRNERAEHIRKDSGRKDKKSVSAVKPVKAVGRTAQKAGKAAGKAVGKGVSIALKCGSFVMMALIMLRMAGDFWAQSGVLGEIRRVAEDRNYAEALYLGIAGMLLLLGMIWAIWILTGKKAADGGRMKSYDTGRGITAFVFYGVVVFSAGSVQGMLPEGRQVLAGASLALQVLNGMKEFVLVCCAVGFALCIIRKLVKR